MVLRQKHFQILEFSKFKLLISRDSGHHVTWFFYLCDSFFLFYNMK